MRTCPSGSFFSGTRVGVFGVEVGVGGMGVGVMVGVGVIVGVVVGASGWNGVRVMVALGLLVAGGSLGSCASSGVASRLTGIWQAISITMRTRIGATFFRIRGSMGSRV